MNNFTLCFNIYLLFLSQCAISTVWKLDECCTIIFWISNYSYERNVTFFKSHCKPWCSNIVLNRHALAQLCLRSSLHFCHKKKPHFAGGNEKGEEQQRGKGRRVKSKWNRIWSRENRWDENNNRALEQVKARSLPSAMRHQVVPQMNTSVSEYAVVSIFKSS